MDFSILIFIQGEVSDDDDDTKPIDLSWPDTTRKRITYVIVAPLIFPLWLTLPDTRTPRGNPTNNSVFECILLEEK